MEKRTKIVFVSLALLVIICFLGETILKPRDKLVKETSEYLYYKEYTIFGLNSGYYKYHKPIDYEGIVVNKDRSSSFVGVPGKGGHYIHSYKTTISYSGKIYTSRDRSDYYNYSKGDKIIVTEYFYPLYKIDFKHK